MDRQKAQDMHIASLEAQIIDLKSDNVRVSDHEIVATRELEQLRDRNNQLLRDAESMRNQIRVQEEAIIGAQHLREKTDQMMSEYDKLKEDMTFQL